MYNADDMCCLLCNIKLKCVFIECNDCKELCNTKLNVYICLECFSQGLENQIHKNQHQYKVCNLNRVKTFNNWNLQQELSLIENSSCLIQNDWSTISNSVNTGTTLAIDKKLPFECRQHFDEWLNMLSTDHNLETSYEINNDLELLCGDSSFKMRENDINPPRPTVHTLQYRRMSGYRAARGDFETEFNDNFEFKHISDIDYDYEVAAAVGDVAGGVCANINDYEDDQDTDTDVSDDSVSKIEHDELENELKMAIIDSYRDVIKKRYELKEFIRDFGLLNELAINSMNSNISTNSTNTTSTAAKWAAKLHQYQQQTQNVVPLKYYRLFKNSQKLDEYVELINYKNNLNARLNELNEYHSNGIKRFKHVDKYKKLKQKHFNRNKSAYLSSLLTTVIRHDVKDKKLNATNCKEWLKKLVLDEKEKFKISLLSGVESEITNDNSFGDLVVKPQIKSTQSASMISQQKHKNSPLKIENYPEADKLNDEEKEFCRVSRIQPIVYLRVKEILILDCNKNGYVTYTRARKIASIDVNKTRKIHNFLLHLNLIKATE